MFSMVVWLMCSVKAIMHAVIRDMKSVLPRRIKRGKGGAAKMRMKSDSTKAGIKLYVKPQAKKKEFFAPR